MDSMSRAVGVIVEAVKERIIGPQLPDAQEPAPTAEDASADLRRAKKQRSNEDGEEPTLTIPAKRIAEWQHRFQIGSMWTNELEGPVTSMCAAVRELSSCPPDDGSDYLLPESQVAVYDNALGAYQASFAALKKIVSRNAKILAPNLHKQAKDLTEKAMLLQVDASEAHAAAEAAQEAAAEAAIKLRATNAALHQSSAGHSDIGSTFPLSTEIAEKVKIFGSSEALGALILEHMLDKFKNMSELSAAMRMLQLACHKLVVEAYQKREKSIMAALGVARSPLVDGFLRK
jgi:hypothetical protein